MDVVKWRRFSFSIKKHEIRAAKDISISMSVETENKTASSENYVKKKNLNPAEISMTGIFSAALGVSDVKKTAFKLANLCRKGKTGYVYFGSSKIMPPKFMGVSAKINNIEITPKGEWSYCEVQITLKQCEKYGGGTAGSSSSSGKKKKKSTGSGSPKKKIAGVAATLGKAVAKSDVKDALAGAKPASGYTPTKFGLGRTSGGGGGKRVMLTK